MGLGSSPPSTEGGDGPGLVAERRVVEGVAERVRGIRRAHEGALTSLGGPERGGGGDGRLADASLAGEQQDAH